MVVGEGLLSAARFALRVVACGNALSLALESNLGRSFSSFPAWAEYLIADSFENSGAFESDGGGGRIRTFEVDDGRFTVCSLWPLGNPTRGNSNFEVVLRDGGGGRIRTFEVDDGRFTVCSLWPLGNPTTG